MKPKNRASFTELHWVSAWDRGAAPATAEAGEGGGDYRGGYLGSESQISEHQYLSDLVA